MSKLMQKNQNEKLFFQNATKKESYDVKITPKIAKRLLENTTPALQRRLDRRQVFAISTAMSNGTFLDNGDTIRQDQHGNIIDGQHRLNAIIEANFTLETIFVKGLATKTIHTIDMHAKARTLTDVLEISHKTTYKYGTSIAATVKFINSFNMGSFSASPAFLKSRRQAITSTYFLQWVNDNPKIIDFVGETMRLRGNGDKLLKASVFCGLKWILDGYNKPEADKFFQMFSDGIGVNVKSPIYILRKKILATKFSDTRRRAHLTQTELIFCFIKSWNNYLDGVTITRMFVPDNLPKIKSVKKQLFD